MTDPVSLPSTLTTGIKTPIVTTKRAQELREQRFKNLGGNEFTASVPWTRTRTCKVILVGVGILAGVAATFASTPIVAGILVATSIVCLTIPIYQTFLNPSQPKEIEITGNSPELVPVAITIEKALKALKTIPENFGKAADPDQVSKDVLANFTLMRYAHTAKNIPDDKKLNPKNSDNELNPAQSAFKNLAKPRYPDIDCHADFCAMPGYAYHATRIEMSNNEYIAAQGATPETHDSFIQLLNENKAAVSVALVHKDELKDTEKHSRIGPTIINEPITIPGRKSLDKDREVNIDAVKVELIGSVHVPGMQLRIDQLKLNGKTHFRINYMGWSDKKAVSPAMLATIAIITEKLRNHSDVKDRLGSPIVVNCKAGVGRSGTFITASDDIRHYLNETNAPGLDTRIKDARSRRTMFVQSPVQYNTLTVLHENLNTILDPLCKDSTDNSPSDHS